MFPVLTVGNAALISVSCHLLLHPILCRSIKILDFVNEDGCTATGMPLGLELPLAVAQAHSSPTRTVSAHTLTHPRRTSCSAGLR